MSSGSAIIRASGDRPKRRGHDLAGFDARRGRIEQRGDGVRAEERAQRLSCPSHGEKIAASTAWAECMSSVLCRASPAQPGFS